MSKNESFQGRRILIVEDEALIAEAFESELIEAGCSIVGPFGCVDDALAALDEGKVEIALLDVRLGDEYVFPVADRLSDQEVPFVFLTGCRVEILPQRHRGRPCLSKPCGPEVVLLELAEVMRRRYGDRRS